MTDALTRDDLRLLYDVKDLGENLGPPIGLEAIGSRIGEDSDLLRERLMRLDALGYTALLFRAEGESFEIQRWEKARLIRWSRQRGKRWFNRERSSRA